MEPADAHGVEMESKGQLDLILESHNFGNLYANSEKPPSIRFKGRFLDGEEVGHEQLISLDGEELKRSRDLGTFGLIIELKSPPSNCGVNGDIRVVENYL